MSKEIYCELLPPGVNNVNNLLKIPNKREILPQSSNDRKESSPIVEKGKFSQETRKKLTDGGYFICEVGNHSIDQLLKKSHTPISIELFSDFPISNKIFCQSTGFSDVHNDFLTTFSAQSEIALNPAEFFINYKFGWSFSSGDWIHTFDGKCSTILTLEQKKLKKDIDVEDAYPIIGEAIDYVEAINNLASSDKFIIKEKISNTGEHFATATYCGILTATSGTDLFSKRLSSRKEYVRLYAKTRNSDGKRELHIGHQCRCHFSGYISPLIVPK